MKEVLFYILLTLIGKVYTLFPSKTYEARFISFNASSDDICDFSQMRFLGRENRANGTVELKKDLSNELYSVSAESYIDSNGDGEYKLLPFSVPQQPICGAMESYWSYVDATLKYEVNTNFPVHIRPCPVPKGVYYFKDVLIKTDDWPVVMPRGYLKGVATLFKNAKFVGRIEIVSHITDIA
ncbi:uncharacterized protein LOC108109437 isoform X1 [Drosophila eugracilis]|uniref:uncharacterized protein LOC108109437 isoform X1 n=1 Tax=Drosophila eugracilis TaxID=29029 RepID=UPI001BDA17E6|nr:uncharacterized protein LOC108109437 isoform X1 [Drosophila eugracilis]